jgi:hypothetical protein
LAPFIYADGLGAGASAETLMSGRESLLHVLERPKVGFSL